MLRRSATVLRRAATSAFTCSLSGFNGASFASRPGTVVPAENRTKTITDTLGNEIHKAQACAIVSLHTTSSRDRLHRVTTMGQC